MTRAWILAVPLLLSTRHAEAQDRPECFSPVIKFNVCEKARAMQATLAAALPMQINANITLSTAIVDGPRVVVTAMWRITRARLDASLQAGHMTMADLIAKMEIGTSNSICSQPEMAAFVRLGGQIQYLYKTDDGFIALAPTVTDCPRQSDP